MGQLLLDEKTAAVCREGMIMLHSHFLLYETTVMWGNAYISKHLVVLQVWMIGFKKVCFFLL